MRPRSWIRLAGTLTGLGGLLSLQVSWPLLRPDEVLRHGLFGVSTTSAVTTLGWGALLVVLAPHLEALLGYLLARRVLGLVLAVHLAVCAVAMDAGLLTFARLARAQWNLTHAERADRWAEYQRLHPEDVRTLQRTLPRDAAALVLIRDRQQTSVFMAGLLHLYLQPVRLYRHPGIPDEAWLARRGIRWRIDITRGRPQAVPLP